jgi:hypothetical protein
MYLADEVKNHHPRQAEQAARPMTIKVPVTSEQARETHVRKDASIEAVLGGAFMGEAIPPGHRLKLVVKPLKMTDGAVFRLEGIKAVNNVSPDYYTRYDGLLRFGIEITPKATLTDIVTEVPKKAEEMLEGVSHYVLTTKGTLAVHPWTLSHYELRPKENLKTQVVIRSRNGEMTATVPRLHPKV